MQRYFVELVLGIDENFNCTDEQLRHMKKVMRYRNGTLVTIIDNEAHVYTSTIVDIEKGLIHTDHLIEEDHELDVDVTLIYCLPKSDKFELVLQKTTEMGVNRIVPMLSRRCVIKSDKDTFKKKYPRYERIIQEACEQSYRNRKPVLEELIKLKDLTRFLSDVNIVAYEECSKNGEKNVLFETLNSQYKTITIIVGPEGGFDREEIDYMESLGIKACSLGKRILRSETAPLYLMSVIGYTRELM